MTQEEDGTIRVVAAIADKQKVVLYKEDGDTVTVSQGDVRLQALMDEIIPVTARGEVAVVSLKKFSVYADFTRQSNGVVRFYKVNRRALGSLTGTDVPGGKVVVVNMEFTPDVSAEQMADLLSQVQDHVAPWLWLKADKANGKDSTSSKAITSAGNAGMPAPTLAPAVIKEAAAEPPLLAAVDMRVGSGKTLETVIGRLEPVTQANSEDSLKDDETIVAVIGNTLIPDVDKLRPYILHAVRNNSTQAVENFLKRVAKVIGKRSHSVVDLMRFLEKGDLPLADDGAILAYKVLKTTQEQGVYVDLHTKKVRQKIGSYVCVDEKMVDPNRHNECSNGLHIARRGYLQNFSGDVCVLTKIDPEDVLVVPHGDANKVRVMGYHILGLVTPEGYLKLSRNQPFTSESGDQLQLSLAIKGEHVARLEQVKIHGQAGTDVKITALTNKVPPSKPDGVKPAGKTKPSKTKTKAQTPTTAKDLKKAASLDDIEQGATISPRDMNRRVNDEVVKAKAEKAKKVTKVKTVKAPKEKPSKIVKAKVITNGKAKPGAKEKKAPKPEAVAAPQPNDSLSTEQKQALKLIGTGVSQSEVSRQTGISRRSLGRLVEKYGTST